MNGPEPRYRCTGLRVVLERVVDRPPGWVFAAGQQVRVGPEGQSGVTVAAF
jgi:hypothetical protein